MKTTTVFRNILISTQALLSLPMGSSAFVLETRRHHHRSHTRSSTGIHASVSTSPATPQRRDRDYDFIEAATEAAIERQHTEAASFDAYAAIQLHPRTAAIEREATSSSNTSSSAGVVVPTNRKVYEMPVYSTSTEAIAEEQDNGDFEFDFVAAATDAAIDRENEEAAFFNTLPWELKLLVFAERIGTGLRRQVRS